MSHIGQTAQIGQTGQIGQIVPPEKPVPDADAVQRVQESYASVRSRLDDAVRRSARLAESVHLVAISKFHAPWAIAAVAACGQRVFGENYVQEALAKRAALEELDPAWRALEWHFTGHTQTNKAKDLAGGFALIHTIGSVRMAEALVRRLPEGAIQPVLMQVNLGEEPQKNGALPHEVPHMADQLAAMPGLCVQGLMCLPPQCGEGEAARPYFASLRALRDDLAVRLGRELPYLSMGMSGDFEQAVDEGATHVRIGTEIFGARAYA